MVGRAGTIPRMKQAFPFVQQVQFEGPGSRQPFAFRHYDPSALVEGKPMRDHLRFASCFWHTMRNGLADPFGAPTAAMPWDDGTDELGNCLRRVDVFMEFLAKCQIDWFCFHDRDIAPERATLRQSNEALDAVCTHLQARMKDTGKRLLWGTACLFAHPRYMSGAGTSPDVQVFAHAAAQVKKAIEVTHRLGGEGYVFWGGREGYTSLLNTDMPRDLRHMAALLRMAVQHADDIGFRGAFYIEPKPREPSVHQYDYDAATVLAFLREHGLQGRIWLNIETNHATLAGHEMDHELRVAAAAGALGSIDANMGTPHCGWDTDQFPTDLYLTTRTMLVLLEHGGFTTGGLNFDAKRRRESWTPEDLFHAHIAGMDAFALGLKAAAAIRADGSLARALAERYASWDSDLGRRIESGAASLRELESLALDAAAGPPPSGRQERLEALLNRFIGG
jgi:xylose isomerase